MEKMEPTDWQPLFGLLPRIRKSKKFSEVVLKENQNGSIEMPYYNTDRIVNDFLEIAYRIHVIVLFDWPG